MLDFISDNYILIVDIGLILISIVTTISAFVKNRRNKLAGIIATVVFIAKAIFDFTSQVKGTPPFIFYLFQTCIFYGYTL